MNPSKNDWADVLDHWAEKCLCLTLRAKWRSDDGRRGTMRGTLAARAVKDTISALEDDAALYHLSHDAPHRPDVHWKQKTNQDETKKQKHTSHILNCRVIDIHSSGSSIWRRWDTYRGSSYNSASLKRGSVACCFNHMHFQTRFLPCLALESDSAFQVFLLASAAWLISFHSCCFFITFPVEVLNGSGCRLSLSLYTCQCM